MYRTQKVGDAIRGVALIPGFVIRIMAHLLLARATEGSSVQYSTHAPQA